MRKTHLVLGLIDVRVVFQESRDHRTSGMSTAVKLPATRPHLSQNRLDLETLLNPLVTLRTGIARSTHPNRYFCQRTVVAANLASCLQANPVILPVEFAVRTTHTSKQVFVIVFPKMRKLIESDKLVFRRVVLIFVVDVRQIAKLKDCTAREHPRVLLSPPSDLVEAAKPFARPKQDRARIIGIPQAGSQNKGLVPRYVDVLEGCHQQPATLATASSTTVKQL